MLSALDLARRIENGDLTAADAVDLCAQAITAREEEVGAFTVLDLAGAKAAASANAATLHALPLRGLPNARCSHRDDLCAECG